MNKIESTFSDTITLCVCIASFVVCTCTELIDDIHDHVDRTDQRLIRETKHIKIIDRKSATCCEYTRAVTCAPPAVSTHVRRDVCAFFTS